MDYQPNDFWIHVSLVSYIKNDGRVTGIRCFLEDLWLAGECRGTLRGMYYFG